MRSKFIDRIKRSDIFETLKHSSNYFIAAFAIRALGLISLPVFTRLLTRDDYGILAVFTAYVGIFTIVLSLNSYTSVGRYYYEKKPDFDQFVGTTLVFVGLLFGANVIVLLCFYKPIANLMKLPGLLPVYLVFACFFAIIYNIYYQILVPQKKSREAATLSTLRGYLGFGAGVVFVCLLTERRYLGSIWGTLLVGLVFSVYLLFRLFKQSAFSFNKDHLKYIATFSFPLIPYHLSGVILAQFDRIMVNDIVDTASTGLYSVGYSIGALLLLVVHSTQTAVIPEFFKFLDEAEYERLDRLIDKIFSIVTLAALGVILFAGDLVTILAHRKFHAALVVVPPVVIGYVFYGMFTVYGRYIGYRKKTGYSTVVAFIAGISNILLNAIFIPLYGYVAAAYTTAASYFLMFFSAWLVAKLILKEKMTPLWVVWRPTVILLLFVAVGHLVGTLELNKIVQVLIKVALLTAFGAAVFWRSVRITRV